MSAPTPSTKPAKIVYNIAGRAVELWDLGAPLMPDFFDLYRSHYVNVPFDPSSLITNTYPFFDANCQNVQMLDHYFENYTSLWTELMNEGKFLEAARLLAAFPLRMAYYWENTNSKPLHKGTPYYFVGVSKIASDDLDEGFLYMHQALEEDKRTFGTLQPQTPAFFFVTLDYSTQNQFFYPRVIQASSYLEQRLDFYRKSSGSTLTLDEFKKRFLSQVQLQEAIFHFVALQHKLLAQSYLDKRLKLNTMSSLHESNLLFSLILTVDAAIKNKDPNSNHHLFRQLLVFLGQSSSPSLSVRDGDLTRLTGEFESDFGKTLEDLLNSRYVPSSGTKFSAIEEDVGIAHGLRNFGAHRVEYQASIVNNFDSILQRMFNLLFFTVEQLYP